MKTLRCKMLVLATGMLTLLAGAVILITNGVMHSQVRRLEREVAAQKVLQAVQFIGGHCDALQRSMLNYSIWDDAYDFVTTGNPDFVRRNLFAETFQNNNFSGIGYYDATGKAVWESGYDRATGDLVPLPAAYRLPIQETVPWPETLFKAGRMWRILLIDGEAVLMAAGGTTLPGKSTEPNGALVLWKRLSASDFLDALGATISLHPHGTTLPVKADASGPGDPLASGVTVQFDKKGVVRGFVPLNSGVAGRPLTLESVIDQHYESMVTRGFLINLLAVTLVALGALAVFALLLRPMVLRPLRQMQTFMQGIDSEQTLPKRLDLCDNDEFGEVAATMNKMLERLEGATNQRNEALAALDLKNQHYQALFESTFQFMSLLLPDGTVVEANQVAADLNGCLREELLNRPLWNFPCWWGSTQEISKLRNAIAKAAKGEFVRLETNVLDAQTGRRTLDLSIKPLRDETGAVTQLLPEARDITEIVQSREEVRRNEDRYRLFLANFFGIAYQSYLADDSPTLFEGSVQEVTGYSEQEFTSGRMTWDQLVHPDDLPGLLECLDKLERVPGFVADNIYRILTREGETRWVHDVCRYITDPEGEKRLLQGAIFDVTARKLAEQQAIDAAERLDIQAKALSAAANGIVITEAKGNIIWVNEAFCRMTGYSAEEVLGKSPGILKSGVQGPDFYDTMWETIRSGRVWQGEITNRRKDGSLYVEEMIITPVARTDGSITHFIAIKQDITHRKQAEIELCLRESLLKGLAEASMRLLSGFSTGSDPMLSALRLLGEAADVDRVYLFENDPKEQSTSQRFEWCREGIVAQIDNPSLQGIPWALMPHWRESLLDGGLVFGHVSAMSPQEQAVLEGQDIQSILLAPIHLDGRFFGFLGFDICRHKHDWIEAERQILAAAAYTFGLAFTRQKSEQDRRDLEVTLRQSQKLETVGTMAGGIAHDFNNLLMGISGFSELALTEASTNPLLISHLEKVLQAARRAKDLVAKMLLFSRRGEPRRIPISLRHVIEETLDLVRAAVPSTVKIQTPPNMETGVVLGDPGQIQQVLMNLCTNAAHAMREKGGVLRIALSSTEVDETTAARHPTLRHGRHIVLTVADTGNGIPPQLIDRIFDPFFTTKKAGEGSGLGLSIVHGIIRDHEGDISVSSTPGRGTSFHILLPASSVPLPVEEPEPTATTPLAPATAAGIRILLIDDEPVVLELEKRLLTSSGYQVAAFSNPREAVDAFRAASDSFHLVITDQTMPEITGLEVARIVGEKQPGLPVILLSGFSTEITTESLAQNNVKAFMKKPFRIRDLTNLVESLVRPVA